MDCFHVCYPKRSLVLVWVLIPTEGEDRVNGTVHWAVKEMGLWLQSNPWSVRILVCTFWRHSIQHTYFYKISEHRTYAASILVYNITRICYTYFETNARTAVIFTTCGMTMYAVLRFQTKAPKYYEKLWNTQSFVRNFCFAECLFMAKYMKYFHLCKVWEIFSRLSDCQLFYVILL